MKGMAFFHLAPTQFGSTPGMSAEAMVELKEYEKIYEHFNSPISRQNNFIQEFYNLAAKWREEVQYSSSIIEICMNPFYQKIIGMGEKVLPLILRELETRPDHWFWALKAITGADPIQPSQRGKISEMAKAWLNWAKENGHK